MNLNPFRKKQLALHIITQNRIKLLEPTLRCCAPYFDVMRVCDGGSTDGTKEMCKEVGAEYYYRKWDDKYHEQDNHLLKRCKPGDWVMIQDSDECPSNLLLEELRDLVQHAVDHKFNMISLPALDMLDGKLLHPLDDFVAEVEAGTRKPFRKFWLFKYDSSIKSFGSPHRSVESLEKWRVLHQPYPYIHTKTTLEFYLNDCVHAFICPEKQEYTRAQVAELRSVLPSLESSRGVIPWLTEGELSPQFLAFA